MDVLTFVAIFLILWGLATLLVGLLKPKSIWKNAKIQGFVSLLSETGTTIFFVIIGLVAMVGGVLILTN
jgi:hypothetical protein